MAENANIKAAVVAGLTQAASNANNDLTQKDVEAVAKTVAPAVQKEAGAIIENLTNAEPLWQSRNFWSSIVIVGVSLAGLGGYAVSAEDQSAALDTIMGVVQAGGFLVTALSGAYVMINRLRARYLKPIGK